MTRVLRPRNLDELWEALARPGAVPLAGGTDLLVWRRAGRVDPELMVSLQDLEALRGVTLEGATLRLGAMETHAGLLKNPLVRERVPAVHAALRVLGSPLVRASATLGGNVATASPGGDVLPPLVAYGAEVELASHLGTRRMLLEAFLLAPGKTALRPGEVLTAVRLPDGQRFHLHHFEKVGRRTALACAVASLAALVRRDGDGRVLEARLAWGAVAPTVLQCPEAEAALVGTFLEPDALRRAGELARACASPLSDVRATAQYRRTLVGNLLVRLAGIPAETSCDGSRNLGSLMT